MPWCIQPRLRIKSSHLCKSDPSSDEPLRDERRVLGDVSDPWLWCLMRDHPPPKPLSSAVKCAPIQILTPRAAPSCLLKHSYNWSSQLSWFLFTESWGLMSVRFDPDLSIFPPDNHPSPLLLYCYRGSSSWQKTVSGRSKCFRKTNEANVNFLPVEFRSNNVFRFTRRKKETVKTVIIPKIWELRFSWMRSRFELFLLSSQIASTSISLVSNYEFQILVNIDHRTDQGLSLGPFWCVSWLLR